jgi:hypothetical protein
LPLYEVVSPALAAVDLDRLLKCRLMIARFPPVEATWQDQPMSWNGLSRKAGGRVRVGRRTISVPSVPSMTELDGPTPDGPTEASGRAGDSDQQPPVDRNAVQYLDRVRAIFRPVGSDTLAPGLERFIGVEDIFRHVGTADMASHGAQPMMQCPSHWPNGATWVPIRDLEILEILDDQDVRAG